MNERFVAVSTVMRSRIHGCFSTPRCDFSVTDLQKEFYLSLISLVSY